VPADDKPFMRATVAELTEAALGALGLDFPEVSGEDRKTLEALRDKIV
jgi:hypothetical protein